MHGLSVGHEVHALTALAGSHHAVSSPHASGPGIAGGQAGAGEADGLLGPVGQLPVGRLPVGQLIGVQVLAAGVLADVSTPDGGRNSHDDACLLALTVSMLTFMLALILARRGRVAHVLRLPRAADLLPTRGPPPRSGPCLFALGVLRT